MPPTAPGALGGLRKLARLSPEEIRSMFVRHGLRHGALRGAALGGSAAYFTGDAEEPGDQLLRTLGGVALGAGIGSAVGGVQGHRIAADPFRRTVTPDGVRMLHLRTPGEFGNELVSALYPAGHESVLSRLSLPKDHPTWEGYSNPRRYQAAVGSGLLGAFLQHGRVPALR